VADADTGTITGIAVADLGSIGAGIADGVVVVGVVVILMRVCLVIGSGRCLSWRHSYA